MIYCTKCGTGLADGSRFCPNCGNAIAGGGAPPPVPPYQPPVAAATTLDYKIEGDNLQVARVYLKAGQELFAEAGKMLYKFPAVYWETRMSGNSVGEKIWGAVKRKLMGESLFFTYFRASQDSEVGFAGAYPGRIQAFNLAPGQQVMVQRDGFLFAQNTVQLDIAFTKRLGAGFFGGEGFILQRITGPGMAFIHAGGDFIEFDLRPGERLQVDTGCIVAFDASVQYDIEFVGGIKTAIFGGEGLFLATLTGPGKVIVQSMTLAKLRREIAPMGMAGGGDERSPLGAFTGIFSSED
ncbi:TIGR00266 family protein [Bryobacterales bacterium F-183]|nr:TIGR00266 family protein [Bryobacterales bacterium F-183]